MPIWCATKNPRGFSPSNPTCTQAGGWTRHCRVTLHYLQTIAPLWQADRRTCDEFGDLITDNTCSSCHTRTRDGALQVPAAQLELTNEASLDRNDYIISYSELLFDDDAQELNGDGALADIRVATDTGEFETNANGEWARDSNGQRIPIIEYTSVPVAAAMSTDGARASSRFFSLFQPEASHAGIA